MNTGVSAQRIEEYRRDGFLVIEELLTGAELSALQANVQEALEIIGIQRVAGTSEYSETEGYRDTVVLQRLNLWKVNEPIRALFHHPELGQMLCALSGNEGLRVWHDQTFLKPPWGTPTSFHLDLPNWSFSSPHAVQIWVALDDVTAHNGCLYYLPGSHLLTRGDATTTIRQDVGALFDLYPELKHIEARPVEVTAGAAVVHNGLTVHAAGANMTPRWRRAMSCQYMPADAKFNGNRCILPHAQFVRLRIGDPLDDEAHYPLVWPLTRTKHS